MIALNSHIAGLLLLVALFPLCLFGQRPLPRIEHLETINGKMPSTQTHDVFQDQDGFICFVGFNVVTRYDGSQYIYVRNDSIKDAQFIYAYPQSSGGCLLSTWHGNIAYYNKGVLRPYAFNDSIPQSLKSQIRSLNLDSDGQLHIGTRAKGYWILSSTGELTQQTHNLVDRTSFFIRSNEDGSPFLFREGHKTSSVDLYEMDSLGEPHFITEVCNEDYKFIKKGFRASCVRLQNGDLLFALDRLLLTIRNGKEVARRNLGYCIYNLLEDSEGGIWVSTLDGGANYIPDLNSDFKQVFFEGRTAGVMAEDSQNGLWITVSVDGVYHMPDRWYRFYNKEQSVLDDNLIPRLEKGDQQVYVLTRSGRIYTVNADSIREFPLPNYPAKSIAFDQQTNTLLVGGEGIIQSFRDGVWEVLHLPERFKKLSIRELFHWKDRDGIGIISGKSLFHFRNGEEISHWPFEGQIYATHVGYKGTIWIGSESGLHKYVDGEWVNLKQQFPMLGERIVGLGQQGDRLWISTEKNIFVLEEDLLITVESPEIRKIGWAKEFEFINDTALIYCKAGLFKLWLNPATDSLRVGIKLMPSHWLVSQRYGVQVERIGDDLYLAANCGIAHLNLKQVEKFHPAIPTTHIRKIQINGKDTNVQQHYDLSHEQKFIQFEYSGIGFRNNKGQAFEYQLSGVDQEIKRTESKSIQYANLDPGDYTFELKTRAFDTPKNSEPARITLTIVPPYWETWWFRTLVVLAAVGLLSGGFILRIVRLRKQSRLERALDQSRHQALNARMSPHFIFNALNSIQLYVSRNDESASTRYVSKFSKLMRQILEHSGRLTVSLEEELEAIRNYLDLEQMRMKGNMAYEIKVEPAINLQQTFVPTMLIQPHVENAVWHGLRHREDDQGKITITVSSEGEQLICRVRDNGVGRQRSAQLEYGTQHESAGTTITKNRMRLISSIFKVKLDFEVVDLAEQSSTEVGTLVQISFPKSFKTND